jgi:hypothetical protein
MRLWLRSDTGCNQPTSAHQLTGLNDRFGQISGRSRQHLKLALHGRLGLSTHEDTRDDQSGLLQRTKGA